MAARIMSNISILKMNIPRTPESKYAVNMYLRLYVCSCYDEIIKLNMQ